MNKKKKKHVFSFRFVCQRIWCWCSRVSLCMPSSGMGVRRCVRSLRWITNKFKTRYFVRRVNIRSPLTIEFGFRSFHIFYRQIDESPHVIDAKYLHFFFLWNINGKWISIVMEITRFSYIKTLSWCFWCQYGHEMSVQQKHVLQSKFSRTFVTERILLQLLRFYF